MSDSGPAGSPLIASPQTPPGGTAATPSITSSPTALQGTGGVWRISTAELAREVNGVLEGPGDIAISGVAALDAAHAGDLSFIRSPKFACDWAASKASAALVSKSVPVRAHDASVRALIRVDDADLAMIRVLELLSPPIHGPGPGVHPTAIVDASARVPPSVRIGPGCVVGARTVLGEGVVLHAGVVLGADVRIGPGTVLFPRVVVYDRCRVGAKCLLHAGVVIGADGFGFHPSPDGQGVLKVPHIGIVEVGNAVEVGANSCIDRGKFGATVVGDGTKIDNLVQVGHNARIGRSVILCGQVGIAGSAQIGDGAMLGGQVGVTDAVRIGAGARLAAQAGVMSEVPAGEAFGGTPAHSHREWLRNAAVLRAMAPLLVPLRELLKSHRQAPPSGDSTR